CESQGVFECRECDGNGLWCQACTIELHQQHPCHRPHKWTGEHFMKISMESIGFVCHMDHGGKPCPYMRDDTGPQKLTIVDINGVHTVTIGWCRCANAPSFFNQLLRRRILPASMKRPRTGFTFRVMRLFHLMNLIAHVTPWDFSSLLHRLTDNVDPTAIPNVYQTFNHVQRQWRLVKAWKRGGVVNSFGPRAPGSLALHCVSCPMPGINLNADWESHPDSELIHTVFIGGDGNFRLRRNNKGGGEKADPSLFGDDAFYAPNENYKVFCSCRGGAMDDQSDSTCRGHRAGNSAVVVRSYNKPTSGIVSLSCGRTGAFMPQGMVDIKGGEKYV
ncbi:hypothetical protein M422DRAFT_166915, partial [Sphaerobolus stellatus SS14]